MLTAKEAARKALLVQDACNPRGVARLLVEVIDRACEHDSDGVQEDPATILVLDKLCSLARYRDDMTLYSKAYAACKELQKGRSE